MMKLDQYIRDRFDMDMHACEESSLYGPLYAMWGVCKSDDISYIERLIVENKAKNVLEYGSGFGRIPFSLNCSGVIYHGVEKSEYLFDISTDYLNRHYEKSLDINFYGADALNESLIISSDLIICAHNFINEISSISLNILFRNIKNSLTKNGVVYIKSITPFPYERAGLMDVVGRFEDKQGRLWLVSVVKDPGVHCIGNNMFIFFDSYCHGVHEQRIMRELYRHIHSYEEMDRSAKICGLSLKRRNSMEGVSIYEHD